MGDDSKTQIRSLTRYVSYKFNLIIEFLIFIAECYASKQKRFSSYIITGYIKSTISSWWYFVKVKKLSFDKKITINVEQSVNIYQEWKSGSGRIDQDQSLSSRQEAGPDRVRVQKMLNPTGSNQNPLLPPDINVQLNDFIHTINSLYTIFSTFIFSVEIVCRLMVMNRLFPLTFLRTEMLL